MFRQGFVYSILFFFLTACHSPQKQYHTHMGMAEGTTFHITYSATQNFDKEIDSLLNHFEDILSTYRPQSVISRFNRCKHAMVITDSLFWQMFRKAQEVNKATNGAFDITVAPLVNAWGFGFADSMQIDSGRIDSLLQFVGMHHLTIHGDTLIKDHPSVELDGNAIAKGQSVDYICRFLQQQGVRNFMVEIGGEVRAEGVNADGMAWRIGIDEPIDHNNPLEPQLKAVMRLENKAVATSGNYRRFYIKNGIRYSHTINPKTGYPVQHTLLSASVLTADCMTADAYATAFMVMGLEQAKMILQNNKTLGVFLIYDKNKTNEVFATASFRQLIEPH